MTAAIKLFLVPPCAPTETFQEIKNQGISLHALLATNMENRLLFTWLAVKFTSHGNLIV